MWHTINLGSGRIDFMRADIFVNGALGPDTIMINDQDAPGAYTYTFAGQTFDTSGPFFGSLSYVSIGDVVLHAGDSGDTIDVESVILSTDLTLFAGGGDDTVNIGSGTLNAVLGEVAADGGLNVLDQDQGVI